MGWRKQQETHHPYDRTPAADQPKYAPPSTFYHLPISPLLPSPLPSLTNIFTVSFSPDGRLLASASFDKSLKIWDAVQGKYDLYISSTSGRVTDGQGGRGKRARRRGRDGVQREEECRQTDILRSIIRFKASLRGHVGAVYQVCWSSDSRMLVSGSKDSTVKLWDLATNKLKVDMPGHADEVYRYPSHPIPSHPIPSHPIPSHPVVMSGN